MKKLYLLTIALLITAGTVFAMENHPENFRSIPVVIRTPQTDHAALSKKITHNLTQVEEALTADDGNTQHNITVNHNAAFKNFHAWLDLFDRTNSTEADRTQSQEFILHIQTLFSCFNDLFNHPKVAAIKDYPITRHDVYSLSLHIQKLAD